MQIQISDLIKIRQAVWDRTRHQEETHDFPTMHLFNSLRPRNA
jgi:hypothetical protein